METFLKTINNSIKYWYLLLIIGILFIALGIYIFTTPLETYITLSVIFSLTFIVSGIFEIFFSVQNSKNIEGWGWHFAGGIFNLLIGIYLILNPIVSIIILPVVVGATMLFRSIQGLGIAFYLKNYGILSWGNLAILSVLGIIFSFILLTNPILTGFSIVTMTALTFITLGIYNCLLSFDFKN